MNLNLLAISVMVLITREWLANPVIVDEMTKHPLGAAIWKEIARIHKLVSEFRRQRMSAEAVLAKLTELVTELDAIHDRKARSLHTLLLTLADATNDPALAKKLLELDALLFPNQLRIVHMSYFEEAGAIIELEQRVTPEVIRTLESVRVADQTLADIYREWVAAGHELGRQAQQRARVEASLSSSGSAAPQTQARKVRSAWIRGVRLLLDSLDMIELSDTARESVLAPLHKSVQDAMLRRSQGSPAAEPDGNGDGDSNAEPNDDINNDIGVEPGAEPDIDVAVAVAAPAHQLVSLPHRARPAELATTPVDSDM